MPRNRCVWPGGRLWLAHAHVGDRFLGRLFRHRGTDAGRIAGGLRPVPRASGLDGGAVLGGVRAVRGGLPGRPAARRPGSRSPPAGPCGHPGRRGAGADAVGGTWAAAPARGGPAGPQADGDPGRRHAGGQLAARPLACAGFRLARCRCRRLRRLADDPAQRLDRRPARLGRGLRRCLHAGDAGRAELDRAGSGQRALAGAPGQRTGGHDLPGRARQHDVAALLVPDRVARGAGAGPQLRPDHADAHQCGDRQHGGHGVLSPAAGPDAAPSV